MLCARYALTRLTGATCADPRRMKTVHPLMRRRKPWHLFDPRHIGIILGDGELHIPQQIWCLHLSVRPQIWCLHLSVSTGTWCLHLSLDFSWYVYYKSAPAWSCFLCPTLYYLRLKYSGQLWPRSYLTWTGRLRAVTGGYTGGYIPGVVGHPTYYNM